MQYWRFTKSKDKLSFNSYILKHTIFNKYIFKDTEVNIKNNYIIGHSHQQYKININKFGQYTTPWHDNLFAERRREFVN